MSHRTLNRVINFLGVAVFALACAVAIIKVMSRPTQAATQAPAPEAAACPLEGA